MATSPPLSNLVAQQVRRLRLARGWSQEQLAEAAGISRDALSRIERGDRAARLDTLDALATALGVDLPGLIAGGRQVPRPPRGGEPKPNAIEASALNHLRRMDPKAAAMMVRVLALVARSTSKR